MVIMVMNMLVNIMMTRTVSPSGGITSIMVMMILSIRGMGLLLEANLSRAPFRMTWNIRMMVLLYVALMSG